MTIGTTLLNDGQHIPNIAFGTGSTMKRKDVSSYVTAALHAGFQHIDTAQAYQNEDTVGIALKKWIGFTPRSASHTHTHGNGMYRDVGKGIQAREDIWVTTKYSGGLKGPLEELKDSLARVRLS